MTEWSCLALPPPRPATPCLLDVSFAIFLQNPSSGYPWHVGAPQFAILIPPFLLSSEKWAPRFHSENRPVFGASATRLRAISTASPPSISSQHAQEELALLHLVLHF